MKAQSISKSPMAKLPVLLLRLIRVGFKIETEFRMDFFLVTLHFLFQSALLIAFWQAVIGHTDMLGHWEAGELVVFSLIVSLQGSLTIPFMGFKWLPEIVREGGLDRYLCRPVNPILTLCFESIHVVEFLRMLIVSLVAIAAAIWYFGLQITVLRTFVAILVLVLGTGVWVLISGTVSLLSFWMGKVETVELFLSFGRRFDRYPIDIFSGPLNGLLTWFLPVAFIATLPTAVLLGKSTSVVRTLGIAALLLLVWSLIFWGTARKALERYEAFGG